METTRSPGHRHHVASSAVMDVHQVMAAQAAQAIAARIAAIAAEIEEKKTKLDARDGDEIATERGGATAATRRKND